MADKYDSNGDYGSYTDNFKRKSSISEKVPETIDLDGENEESSPATQKAGEYVRELLAEKLSLDQNKLPNATRLIDQEVTKVQQIGKAPLREVKYVDIYREKPIKVTVKVLVPFREHPKFNFVGKLLGPKGNSMKRLQEETMCKMAVLGRGSMKDRNKEEECRNSLDPKYSHLSDDLHVEISALGPPAEAHARVAYALAEVRKYLIPDNNDNIRMEQMREMEIMSGDTPEEREREMSSRRSILRAAIPRSVMPMRTATRTPVISTRSVMPAKTKIMSILDRARVAMEESYGYEDELYEPASPPPPAYDRYAHAPHVSHAPPPTSSSKSHSHYYDYEYEPEYYRESSSSYEPSSSRWKNKPPSTSARHSENRYRTSPYTLVNKKSK